MGGRTPTNRNSKGKGSSRSNNMAATNKKQQQHQHQPVASGAIMDATAARTSNYLSLNTMGNYCSDDDNDDDDLSAEFSLLDKEEEIYDQNSSLLDQEEEEACNRRRRDQNDVASDSSTSDDTKTSIDNDNEIVNPIARMRATGGVRHRNNRNHQRHQFDAPPPPPKNPPPPHLLSSRPNKRGTGGGGGSAPPSNSSSSQYESFDSKSQQTNMVGTTSSSTTSTKNSNNSPSLAATNSTTTTQKNALVSILQEMRLLEQRLQTQSQEHAKERTSLLETLSQQSRHISQLENTNQTLVTQNATLRVQLGTILAKLDRFATGCWKFSSSSVKKMSEALHIQVHEWGRLYDFDTTKVGEEERDAMERTTMEKMQSMHLEIKKLKLENCELKGRITRSGIGLPAAAAHHHHDQQRSKKRGNPAMNITDHASRDSSNNKSVLSSSLTSRMMDQSISDEASNMSGITHMTSSTAKLMDAMSGFLNECDGDGDGRPTIKQQRASSTLTATNKTTTNRTTKTKLNTTPIISSSSPKSKRSPKPNAKSPPSILKKTNMTTKTTKYNDHARLDNEQRVRLQVQQLHRQKKEQLAKQQPLQQQQQQQHVQIGQQKQQHKVLRHETHHAHPSNQQTTNARQKSQLAPPGLPKSPMRRRNKGSSTKPRGVSTSTTLSSSSSSSSSKTKEGFANFDDPAMQFPDFNDFATTTDENRNQWASTWGDEESEV